MPPTLTAREVCQRLRNAALGTAKLRRISDSAQTGYLELESEGWRLTLDFEGHHLHQCERCQCPDGRKGELADWQRYGTDPVSLLSTWELAQIEKLLIQIE